MPFPSKKISLLILVLTSFILSRAIFFFINDPEGPNLLIVTVMAAIIYAISWAAYSRLTFTAGFKKLLTVIVIQLVTALIALAIISY